MKCCGSPTTSIVPNASRTRDVAAAFNALLFSETLKPLAKAMGFYGDTVARLAATAMARNERGGMTDRLEAAIASVAEARAHAGGAERTR